ncbi:MAG: enoyl-CoA hydratase/isomerase family protein [Pseudomonadota bacterium]
MSEFVTLAVKHNIATVTLNRPDKANALTACMLTSVAQAVRSVQAVPVLVVTGVGKVFSAGADLEMLGQGLATDPAWEDASHAIAAHPGLSVARLNGTAAGGAMGMVLACDLRVAVSTANFFYPVLANGVDPQPSDPKRMADLVGPSRTAAFFCLGQKITASTAHDWGLVNDIVDPDGLDSWVSDQLAGPAAAREGAIQKIKQMIRGA